MYCQKVKNTEQFLLSDENGFLEIVDLENDELKLVEKVYYHDINDLYLFKVDGVMMHNFILEDDVVDWLRKTIEVV